jgi:hypothetical protein
VSADGRRFWFAISALVVGLFVFPALMAGCSLAWGNDGGRFPAVDPEIKAWVKSLTDQKGEGCCDTADGYPAEAEWDNDAGKYRVWIESEPHNIAGWFDVPDDALITKPNRLGYAVVWWYPQNDLIDDGSKRHRSVPHIRCFLPGAGG